MDTAQKEQTWLTICPQCRGSGYIRESACPACVLQKMPPLYGVVEGSAVFFPFASVTSLAIAERRAVLKLDFIINFLFFLIGGFGIFLLGFFFYTQLIATKIVLPLGLFSPAFWDIRSIYFRMFLFTFFGDIYLSYRLSRKEEREQRVIKKTYHKSHADGDAKQNKEVKRWIDVKGAYSEEVIAIIEETYLAAQSRNGAEIKPLHFLATLLTHEKSNLILFRLGINPGVLAGKIKRGIESLAQHGQHQKKEVLFSPEAQQIVADAYYEAYIDGGGRKVDILDFWIPFAEVPGYAKEILYDLDIESYKLRHVATWVALERKLSHQQARRHSLSRFKSRHGMNRAMTAVQTQMLNAFSEDLTLLARRGYLPPSLGHKREMETLFTVFQSGARGAVFVGSPGVGKQSMVEEIAERMGEEQVPAVLQDRRLVSLHVAAILAGGDTTRASERLYQALSEAAHSGNVVLFIKDIHNLAGLGLHAERGGGSIGIDNLLAQALESGGFLLVATTDHKSYARYIEHSALAEVLTKIPVDDPGFEETVLMLEARVPYIEGKHRVFFTYQALERTVELTNKLIHSGEHQPEKALKILQETAAYVAEKKGKNMVVTDTDIASVLSAKINMPLSKITQDEGERLLHLEDLMHERYINQDYAVGQVAAALRRARAELRDEKRPIANFLFVGPTGVGKTELAKRIAAVYFNSENDMIRMDMSEFQEVSSIGRLIGISEAPGLMTEAIRTNPYSILLLDELEKAHPNILNLFLQVMDDGRITSGDGEVIDCTNLIIIATSNAGTSILQDYVAAGKNLDVVKEQFIKRDLLAFFRPEFLNRFDDVIIFKPLTPEAIEAIAGLILSDISVRLLEKGITMRVTAGALKELAQIGFDPLYGARPLRRAIQDHVQNSLANYLIAGKIGRRDTVVLESGGEIRVEKAREL